MAASSPASAPMTDALAAAADELRRLGAMGERLQDTLSPLLLSSPTVMAEAQALDRIVQYAHDLAVFIERCGEDCATDWRMNPATATAELKLAELAGRLGAAMSPHAPTSAHTSASQLADAGDLELW